MYAAQFVETSSNTSLRKSTYETLIRIRNEIPSNVIFCFLNINFIRFKFENHTFFFMNNVDISLTGETKLNPSFLDA